MATVANNKKVLRGGEFLVSNARPEDVFIPEEMNEEQQMIRNMVRDFLKN